MQDPATAIVPPDSDELAISPPAEQTPFDAATAIFAAEDEAPAAADAMPTPDETPRDAPTAILPPEEEAMDEEMPGAQDVLSPEAAEPAPEERPLPPELTPVEHVPAVAEPLPPAGHTPPSGMTTPFPPEEIEAEARLPHQDTDRSESPPVAATQPRLHEHLPAPKGGTTPHRLRVEPPRPMPPITPPPPAFIAPPAPPYSPPPIAHPFAPGLAYVQQRVNDYLRGGYRLHQRTPTAAVLSRGKSLGVGGWLLALLTGIGLGWYLLLVLFSGLRPDRVYITLESDGLVYEDGPGAAHVRRGRARAGRRWAWFGAAVFALSLLLALMLGAIAAVYLRTDTNQAALREAYPAITLFEEQFSPVQANPDDVALARDGFVAWVILAGVAVVGMWGGATLFVVGTVHHGAFRVSVPPLPGWG